MFEDKSGCIDIYADPAKMIGSGIHIYSYMGEKIIAKISSSEKVKSGMNVTFPPDTNVPHIF